MKLHWQVALTAALFIVGACDQTPSPPPVVTTQASDTTPKGPTTQQLLTAPRTRLLLGPLPLSVRVPSGWKIDSIPSTGAVLLVGPTPSGEASIQLSTRALTPTDKLDLIIKGAKKDIAEKNDPRDKAELKTLGNTKVLERFIINSPGPLVTMDMKGVEHTRIVSGVKWTIQVFVPQQGNYETYELNFLGLTLDQFDTDKPLLTDIIESLTYEGVKT